MNGREEQQADANVLRCDLCGAETTAVQRVALDGEYDRLTKPHTVLYACQTCHERKDQQRLGLIRS